METPRLWPVYLGGFLGPFGGAMVSAMVPEMARGLGTSVATAATALTWYMVPFAGLMLVSGTLGARLGLARAVRWAFVGYAVASLVCVLASSPVPFLAGRGLQGAANAFTTPLLLALLHELVPADQLGRAFGTYAAFGAAGQAFAPLVGGLAAGVNYRWAFVGSAAVALALVALSPSGRPGHSTAPPRWRDLANPALARACVSGFAGQLAGTFAILFTALIASDRFGLSPSARGAVVALFGVTGFVLGRPFGHLTERFGLVHSGMAALAVAGLAGLVLGVAPYLVLLGLAVALAGAGATGARVLTNGLSVRSTPSNPAGATSIALATSFLGSALVPALVPLYHAHPGWVGVVPLAVCAVAILIISMGGRAEGRTAGADSL